jgi:hypothetical protein
LAGLEPSDFETTDLPKIDSSKVTQKALEVFNDASPQLSDTYTPEICVDKKRKGNEKKSLTTKKFKLKKHVWTEEEDSTLLAAHLAYGNKWAKIRDEKFPYLSSHSLRQRYVYAINLNIDHSSWTENDIELLRKGIDSYGIGDWQAISENVFSGTRSAKNCESIYRRKLFF